MTESGKVVRIGGASGALNDSAIAVPGLLKVEGLNYLAFDYLGEGAMGIFRRMKQADPRSGFLPDFVDIHIGPYLRELKARGIRVTANAGGMNPEGLADLIRQRGREQGLELRVATVTGDDVEHLVPTVERLQQGFGDLTTGGGTIQIGHAPTLDPGEPLLVVKSRPFLARPDRGVDIGRGGA